MPAEITTTSVSSEPPSAKCMRCRAVSPSSMRVVFLPVCTRDAQRLDARAQQPAAALVDLHGHEPRRELDHVGREAEVLQRLRRFEAQQAAADHHAARGVLAGLADGLEVFDGAVDEQPGRSRPGIGGTNGLEPVARISMSYSYSAPLFVDDALAGAIDGRHRIARVQLDAVLVEELARGEREVLDARAGEILGEVDAVVGQPRLFREHGDRKIAAVRPGSAFRETAGRPCRGRPRQFVLTLPDLALVRWSNEPN